jgi:hypothetical protein
MLISSGAIFADARFIVLKILDILVLCFDLVLLRFK